MAILLVNFGGPRDLDEIEPFLCELLCDPELIRPRLPLPIHNFLFRRIAKKRAPKIKPDYELIGGKSPIYETTEALADALRKKIAAPILTFHRYLTKTHASSLSALEQLDEKEIIVFPFFPQFSYATTGSIATFFQKRLTKHTLAKLRWIRSYPTHPSFIDAWVKTIQSYLELHKLNEKETAFLLSAHGLPQSFVDTGDPYQKECEATVHTVLSHFPHAIGKLAYQSKFGPGEWLRPYTQDAAEELLSWNNSRKHTLFVPIAFTSDHIETLFEIETLYLPIAASKGSTAHRCPTFNQSLVWLNAISQIVQEGPYYFNDALLR